MRRAARTDANHAEIVNALRGLGCSVETLHRLGDDVPDLLVAYGGRNGADGINLLAEVKSHGAGTVKGEPSEGQRRWIAEWRGPVVVIRSLEDCGRVVDMMKARLGALTIIVAPS